MFNILPELLIGLVARFPMAWRVYPRLPGDGGSAEYHITYVGSNFNAGDLAAQKAEIPAKFANQF